MAKRNTLDTMGKRQLIKALDSEFSMFIRMSAADDNGYVACPTCGRVYLWNSGDIHCSHYYGRANFNVRWDERNVIAQCSYENTWMEGNKPEMIDALVAKWGTDELRQMRAIAKLPNRHPDVFWLQEKIREYRAKNKKLREEKGLRC